MSSHQGVVAYISPIEFIEVEDILDLAKEKNEPPYSYTRPDRRCA